VTIDTEGILHAAQAYPALRISSARAAEIAAEIADFEQACDEAVRRFGHGDADAFVAELLRLGAPAKPSPAGQTDPR
jgi:hypothetical protein